MRWMVSFRVTGYAHQSRTPVTFSIGATTFARGVDKPTFGYYSMPPGKPHTVEITAWMPERYMVQIEPYGITDRNQIREIGIENYKGPGLAILKVDVEGPLTKEFPSRGHKLLFSGLDRREKKPSNASIRNKPWYKPEFEIRTASPGSAVAPVLQRIVTTAFRRPATTTDVAPYTKLFNRELDAGATIEDALRTATSAVFCSPDFLFLREQSGLLDSYALSARLSYFLTRTTPDPELLTAASSGIPAGDAATLRKHTERLMDDERFERFIADFTDSWLNLRDIEFTQPDSVLFPEYDTFLAIPLSTKHARFCAN